MASFLDLMISISIQDTLLVLFAFGLMTQIPHIFFWIERKKWNPEGQVFITARKEGFPIIEQVAMNGFTEFKLGKKDVKGDPVFTVDRNTRQGVHLDPRLSSGGVPKEYIRGAELMHYSTAISISMSSRTALAMSTIIMYVRKNYEQLNFLPDELIIELVHKNRSDLLHDCRNVTEIYDFEGKIKVPQKVLDAFRADVVEQLKTRIMENGEDRVPTDDEIEEVYQQNITAYEKQYQARTLADLFKEIQDESVILPVETEKYFSFAEAFQRTPLATFASDLQNYLTIIELIAAMKNSIGRTERIWIYIIAIIAIIIGGAVAMNMLPK